MARERLEGLGLRLSFSTNAEVMDRFDSSSVEARVSDLHEAFADPGAKGILTTLRRSSCQRRHRPAFYRRSLNAGRLWAIREPPLQLQARLFQVEVALYAVHDLVPDTAFVA